MVRSQLHFKVLGVLLGLRERRDVANGLSHLLRRRQHGRQEGALQHRDAGKLGVDDGENQEQDGDRDLESEEGDPGPVDLDVDFRFPDRPLNSLVGVRPETT